MLRRASVMDVQNGRVSREGSYLAVVMRYYPRFLKRELVDEYLRELSPGEELFGEFKRKDRELKNHNSAFYLANYEARFELSEEGRARLGELCELSRTQDVVLICQCRDFERCHCDLLLLWARHRHGAAIKGPIYDYPVFKARLEAGELG